MLWSPWTWDMVQPPSYLLDKGAGCPDPKLQPSLLPFEHLPCVPLPENMKNMFAAAFVIFFLLPQNCRTVQAGRNWSHISFLRAFPENIQKTSRTSLSKFLAELSPLMNYLFPALTRPDPSASPYRMCSRPPWWPSAKLSPVCHHFTCIEDPNLDWDTASQLKSYECSLNGNNSQPFICLLSSCCIFLSLLVTIC